MKTTRVATVAWAGALLLVCRGARAGDPTPDFEPSMRLGVRAGAGGLVDPRNGGALGELTVLGGVRVATKWSLAARADIDLGWWSVGQSSFLFGGSLALGGEYTARHALSPGASWQLGGFAGAWMVSALCDGTQSPRCRAAVPELTLSWSVLPESGHDPVGPLWSWSVGVSATLGYSPPVGEVLGRITAFAGVEWF